MSSEEQTEASSLRETVMSNQALCHIRLKEWEKAHACADLVLAKSPSHAKARYRRGVARMELGDVHSALDDLREAVRGQPKSPEVRTTYERCKKLVRAAGEREKVFGAGLVKALDVSLIKASEEEESAAHVADANAAPAAAPLMPPAMGGGSADDEDKGRAYYENEWTIADARMDGNEGNLVLCKDDGMIHFKSMEAMGGKGDGYTWGQSEKEIVIHVPVAAGTKSNMIEYRLTSTTLKLWIHGKHSADTILHGQLWAPVIADESTYQLDSLAPKTPHELAHGEDYLSAQTKERRKEGMELVITLVKATPTKAEFHWPCVLEGEPMIDVGDFGSPVVAINEDSKDDVQAYMRIMEGANKGQLPPGWRDGSGP